MDELNGAQGTELDMFRAPNGTHPSLSDFLEEAIAATQNAPGVIHRLIEALSPSQTQLATAPIDRARIALAGRWVLGAYSRRQQAITGIIPIRRALVYCSLKPMNAVDEASNSGASQRIYGLRARRECLVHLGCVVLVTTASACLAPRYSVEDRRSASGGSALAGSSSLGGSGGSNTGGATVGDAGAAGEQASGGATYAASGGASSGGSTPADAGDAGNTLNLHYCVSAATAGSDASASQDWSCVTPTKNNSTDTPGVVVSGTFLPTFSNTVFDRLDYCPIFLATCDDTQSPLPDFSFTSTQQGCALINWHEGSTAYSGTMWHTITHASSLLIGTVPLVNSTVVRALASALLIPITADGSALIGIRDCSGNTASGVRFAAQSSVAAPVTGLHFSIQGDFSIPESSPTGSAGLGGLANLTAGATTIYGYIGDGCIVAEARIVSETSRIAYVYLVPNGYR